MGAPAINESAVLSDVAGGSYRASAQFEAVSRTPYPSALGGGSNINVYVTAPDFAAYTRIAPETTGSGATVATGTLLVREVRDASGAVQKLTLMMKGPPGYNPEVGDFWFGVTQPDGTPMMDSGAPQMGKLSQCFACHIQRASDGYLFGVPAADRAPPLASGADAGTTKPDGGVAPDGGGAPDAGCDHAHGHGCATDDMGK